MPILDTRHDLAHPVEGDTAWSESYYFNAYDPETDSGLFSRIGIRPNEGTMDVGMSLWLPGGELGEYRWVKEQRDMVDTVLDVGAVRYEMLEALQSWRLTMEDAVQARPTGKSRAEAEAEAHPVKVALDVRFDAITPAVGTDGQPGGGPKSKEAAAASGTVGKGHLEQAGRWTGTLTIDGVTHEWKSAHGNRDRSWGPRRWGGPKMWRWFSINIGDDLHFGSAPTLATCTGAGCGTAPAPRRWPSGGCGPSSRTTASPIASCTSMSSISPGAPSRCAATCCGSRRSARPAARW